MVNVIGKNKIQVSRGDHGSLTVRLNDVDDGETVVFSVADAVDGEVLVEKTETVMDGAVTITLMSSDTKNMATGEYVWDIVFPDFFAAGEPHTPARPHIFEVVGVSHDV